MMGYNPITSFTSGRAMDIQVKGSHDAIRLKKLLKKIDIIPTKCKQITGSCDWLLEVKPSRNTSDFQLRAVLSKIHSARIIS